METIKLGSLYFGGKSVAIGDSWNNAALTVGDTDPIHPLSWVKVGNLLVADHVICTSISWDELNQAGFIFGWPVQIDGSLYLCRSLKVGNQEGVPNEWDAILDKTTEDDNLWHWSENYFWGQETLNIWASYRAVRGSTARHWGYNSTFYRDISVGFRPALEKLPSEPLVSNRLIGCHLKIYGPGGVVVSGKLMEVSEYDLVLKSKNPASGMWCSPLQEGVMAVDRSAIIYTSLA